MTDLKPFIDYIKLNSIPKEKVLELLKNNTTLQPQEKNLIFAFCFPRTLIDRELPNRVMEYRKKNGIPVKGLLYSEKNLGEVILILEACKTEQYGRFMKHLMHAFCDPSKVFPVKESDSFECCICGKSLLGFDDWNTRSKNGELDKDREYLSFGSSESSVVLCIDCLTNLVAAQEIITKIDPGFLDWTLKEDLSPKITWDDLKL